MSKITQLAAGQITKSDHLTVELHQPPDTPAVVLLRWPGAPSVVDPNTKALATIAASMVRVLAEAQVRLAQIRYGSPGHAPGASCIHSPAGRCRTTNGSEYTFD